MSVDFKNFWLPNAKHYYNLKNKNIKSRDHHL